MGFFSSRKHDNDYIAYSDTDKSRVVQVIRSRFYGKHKGKGREEPSVSFISQDASTAQTLSTPSSASHASIRKSHSAPISKSSTNSSNTSRTLNDRYKAAGSSATTLSSPLSKTHTSQTFSTSNSEPNTSSPKVTATARKTDNVTMTLAQRLNELASANSEGLLDDDEYRLLRQNLFERFASTAVVPTENPIVPVNLERPIQKRGSKIMSEGRPSTSSRPSSNFNVDLPRSPSIRSRTSVRSGMASLLQRATGRRSTSGSKDFSDTSSIFSATSNSSKIFSRPGDLKQKSSSASVHSDASRLADTGSISSRRAGSISERSPIDSGTYTPQTPSRATRRLATPPSSFPARGFVAGSKYTGSVQNIFDEENLATSQDIKQEIAAVEAEAKRLVDAFNGLEVTTLAKRQRQQVNPLSTVRDSDGTAIVRQASAWTLIPEPNNHLRASTLDSDVTSVRSGTSIGTAPSIKRSVYTKTLPLKGSNTMITTSVSRPGSLRRKNSSSSVASSSHASPKSRLIPPVPALPANLGQLGGHASNSSINLTRSTGHLPMSSVPEDEVKSLSSDGDADYDADMEEIRRRRDEVSKRYKARVEYLKAKLKGAELHEKLMRK